MPSSFSPGAVVVLLMCATELKHLLKSVPAASVLEIQPVEGTTELSGGLM
jgi:hypothetical protein